MRSAGRLRGNRVGGIRAAGVTALVGLLASGCATLPSSGPITKVGEGDEGAAQVQTWPSPPSAGESPSDIVGGFLEAARSGASNQRIAAAYLTSAMQKTWQGEQNTVIVLADYSEGLPQSPADAGSQQDTNISPADQAAGSAGGSDAPTTVAEQVQGTVIGQLGPQGLYGAQSGRGTFQFTVESTKAGYRISQLPDDFGVLMERSDFESSYSRHTVYYGNPQRPGYYVPTEMYLPVADTDSEVAGQMARLIVSRVPPPLSPAMQDAMTGADFVGLDLAGSGEAIVTIKANGACTKNLNPCDELAQQLAQSLGGLSTKVDTVAVVDQSSGQSTQQHTPISGVAGYGLDEQGRTNPNREFFAVSSDGALESVNASGGVTDPDISFAGSSKVHFTQVAVAPGGIQNGDELPDHVALLGSDGYSVYVAHRQGGSETLSDIFPGTVVQPGGTVGRLAWDSDSDPEVGGALWFTYTLNHVTSVYRYFDGELSQVTVTGLGGGSIVSVAPAPDGDRVAIGYANGQDDSIAVAAAVPQAGGGFNVNLGESEVVAAGWDSITQFDWYDEDSLAVLGLPPNAQELGLYQLYADGSPVYDTLTLQPVQASPPSQADGFVWNAGGQPIAAAVNQGKDMFYTLSVEGQEAQPLSGVSGISPSY